MEIGKQQGSQEEGEEEEAQNKQVENSNNSAIVPILENQFEGKKKIQGTCGTKRDHVSESSDSDKEVQNITRNNELEIVTTTPSLGVWQKAQKKKGKKEKSNLSGRL